MRRTDPTSGFRAKRLIRFTTLRVNLRGRPLRGREFGNDMTVKIPGEIDVQRVRRILEELRRRLADPSRPKVERARA